METPITGWSGRLAVVWSVTLPRHLDRTAPQLADGLADGTWTAARPPAAALLPLVSFGVGWLASGHWPGLQDHVFTSSLSFLMVAIAGSILSGAVGVALLGGYVVGDLLSNPFDPNAIAGALWYGSLWARIEVAGTHPFLLLIHYGALVVGYALLAAMVVVVPQFGRRVSEEAARWIPDQWHGRVQLRAALFAAAAGVLVYLWAQAAVVLVRPLQTSKGSNSIPSDWFAAMQDQWLWLVLTALAAALLRQFLEKGTADRPASAASIRALHELRWSGDPDRGGFWSALPTPVQTLLLSAVTALVLTGIATDAVQMLITATGVAAIQTLRHALAGPLAVVTRVPAGLRFLVAFGTGWLLLNASMKGLVALLAPDGTGFLPVLVGALIMMAIFGVMFPKAGRGQRRRSTS